MMWWTATVAVLALAGAAIATRNSTLSFATLAAFVPLALHTLYNDFGYFWVLIVMGMAVLVAALARNTSLASVREPSADQDGEAAAG